MSDAGVPRKYQPLLDWLQALPADQDDAALSLDAIAQLIGRSLPKGAFAGSFWANGNHRPLLWTSVGFRAHMGRHTKVVTFMRLPA